MLSKIKELWNKKGFEIVLGLCIAFILIFGLYKKISGQKGTWDSSSYKYLAHLRTPTTNIIKKTRNVPTESKGEKECRDVLQNIFKKPFNKARPDFLRNPVTGGSFNLELDCFCPELNLAVEYNGVQHYKFVPYFHKNKEAFLNQKYRDDMKRRICKENRINLIEVPYSVDTNLIRTYLIEELKKINYI